MEQSTIGAPTLITLLAVAGILVGCGSAASSADANGATVDGTTAIDAGAADAAKIDAGELPDEWDELVPAVDGVWIRVRNRCAFPLWIHAAGSSAVLEPDDAELASGQTRDYQAPRDWSAARITAYKDGPRTGEIEKAEATLQKSGDGAILNYNITYVDWVGLPMRMAGAGAECGATHTVGCLVPWSDILTGCPAHLIDGDRCQSARSHCANPANQGSAYCHALDDEIAECAADVAGCAGYAAATTPEVYACSGPFATEPRLCAALNRGMLDDPDNSDEGLYYVTEPYNTYASWVHELCPGIYAFSYDDWLAQGGFRSCRGTELRITFCPAD